MVVDVEMYVEFEVDQEGDSVPETLVLKRCTFEALESEQETEWLANP